MCVDCSCPFFFVFVVTFGAWCSVLGGWCSLLRFCVSGFLFVVCRSKFVDRWSVFVVC